MSEDTTTNKDTQSLDKSKLSEEERLKLINETAQAVKEINKIQEESGENKEHEETIMLVAFAVGNEEYAVAIDQIKEVVPCPSIAPIPQVPPYIMGVSNVRGNVLAIVDLAVRFGLTPDEVDGRFVLVMKSEELRFAINVKSVPNTMLVKKSEILQANNIINQSTLGLNYVKGIIRKGQKIVVWVDMLDIMQNENIGEN
ncbi:chemotaxis protein CheW [Reichenbachiella ulvae]|uniref:Chemotaxis protein CheW n=1 Tax=Reichenbachiella ulvae TaxID=2980104 RepID=A0ABT3CPG6_9BACT|nr:chemotaxis protein CheW [Reichenbachiella ulvae]MCV9385631.1 chemotaxis protein CheW [Reichenbachiella ulvae]